MPPKTPNYSLDRSQRERAQQAKAQKKADLRAEKSAKRKEARGEVEPTADAIKQVDRDR
jgi:hypothetical protein